MCSTTVVSFIIIYYLYYIILCIRTEKREREKNSTDEKAKREKKNNLCNIFLIPSKIKKSNVISYKLLHTNIARKCNNQSGNYERP